MTALLLSNFPFVTFYTWIHKCDAIEQENNYLSGGNNVFISLKQLTCLILLRLWLPVMCKEFPGEIKIL